MMRPQTRNVRMAWVRKEDSSTSARSVGQEHRNASRVFSFVGDGRSDRDWLLE